MANNPVKDLLAELTCSICLDHFKDPVSIDCGHCFCRECILESWRGIRTNYPCPHCRRTSKWKFLRPNRSLLNVVEISNRLLFPTEETECIKQCKRHQEPLKFYCQVDAEEICVICRESVDHRSHAVLPVEESTKEFVSDVQERLKALRCKAADFIILKNEEGETALKLQDEILQKRKMVASEFEAMRQLLTDQEKYFTNRLDDMQRTIMQKHKERISWLNAQMLTTQKTISDLEKHAAELLNNQELAAFSESYELEAPPSLRPQIRKSPFQLYKPKIVQLFFDLKTINQNLVVFGRRTYVKYVEDPISRFPCPERFDSKPCVLAHAGFRSGRYYWEVEVGGGIYWTVGVAKSSVRRKGAFRIEPNGGIWAIGLLGMYMDRYFAFTNPDTRLSPQERPERIGVYLDCNTGCVSFYNAVSYEHIFTFDSVEVQDKIYPFFCVGALGTELKLDDLSENAF